MTTTDAPSAPPSLGTPTTLACTLRKSPALAAAVRAIVDECKRASGRITDVRPSNPGLKESYDALMKRAADVRGRALLYPYLGSGLGNGALVELADGSVKWDMICGIGVHFFGHSDPEFVEAAAWSTIDDTLKHGNLQSGFEPYEFLEVLVKEASKNSRLKHGYIATGGAMANENALKLCYHKHTPASRVIAFKDCFMGRSNTMVQIGDSADGRPGLPLNVHVDYMPFYDVVAAKQMGETKFIDSCVARLTEYTDRYPGQHACFIFELVQGEGGFNVGTRDYFKALMDVCRAKRIAIWDDEIQTFGRTSRMFAYELFDLGDYVDVFCVGKMTQACVTMWTSEYNPKVSLLSGTFTGEGVSFRTGQRVVERLRDGHYYGPDGKIEKHHAAFRTHAKQLIAKHPEWFPAVPEIGSGDALVGGTGGMMRLTPFAGKKDKINAACKACFEEGVVLFYCGHGPWHLRMLPPLGVMKMEDWPRVFACLEKGLAKAAS